MARSHRTTTVITLCALASPLMLGACGAGAGAAAADQLRQGTCFNWDELPAVVEEVKTIDCEEPHTAQVIAQAQLPGDDWPGEDQMAEVAESGCLGYLRIFAEEGYEEAGFSIATLSPTAEGWEDGDRSVVCVLVSPEPTTDSVLKETEPVERVTVAPE